VDRRDFIKGAAAIAAAPCSCMKQINFNQGLGVINGSPLVSLTVPAPLPGNIWITTVAEQYALEILGVFFQLTTDANVANRNVFVQALDVNIPIGFMNVATTQAAGLTLRYAFTQGQGNNVAVNTFINGTLGRIICPPKSIISGSITNGQVGDTFANIRIMGLIHEL
jgi:hypothetical protein